jgi:hypothetical protein
VEQPFNLPPLASRKPSELFTWASAPGGQENNAFFHCLLLNKLPRELRVLLIEADIANKHVLCTGADSFLLPTTASYLTMWERRWPPCLSRIVRERTPRWRQSIPGLAAASAAAGADSKEERATRGRRSADTVAVVAAASR